jgi:hypothetical protein
MSTAAVSVIPSSGELQRGRVGPVEVVDRQHDRPLVGQARDQLADDLERAVLDGFGRELGHARRGVRFEREAEHRAEVRVDLEHAVAEQALDLAAQRYPHAELRLLERDAEPLPEHVAVRPVGKRLAVRHAAAFEPEGRSARRLCRLEEHPHLAAEPALPDSGLAGDEEDAAGPAEHRGRALSRDGQLLVPADERRLHAQHAPCSPWDRSHARCPIGDDRVLLALELQLLWLAPVEERLDEVVRGLADEHRPRSGGLLEPCCRVDRVADRAVLDARAASDRAEDDRAGVDADSNREAVDAPARLDLRAVRGHLVGDSETGANGPLRIVLVGHRRSEEREDPVAGEILDRAAQSLNGGQHPGDRLADDQPHFLGVEPLPERGRPNDVSVECRHRLALFAHRRRRFGVAHASLIAARSVEPGPRT